MNVINRWMLRLFHQHDVNTWDDMDEKQTVNPPNRKSSNIKNNQKNGHNNLINNRLRNKTRQMLYHQKSSSYDENQHYFHQHQHHSHKDESKEDVIGMDQRASYYTQQLYQYHDFGKSKEINQYQSSK
ncbi:hypothetical protein SNEBB_006820 [Seison nebaliae]|nr:hypothetical protein SNEBB_006820 [Seison nebaliae]